MQPLELWELIDGYEEREDIDLRKRAWLAATIINGTGWRKKPVTIDDLLPKKKTDDRTGSQIRADYEALKLEASKRRPLKLVKAKHG